MKKIYYIYSKLIILGKHTSRDRCAQAEKKMSWYSKIKSKIEKKDDSPELKRGQVKQILISEFERELPEFNFLEYRNCY